MPPSNHTTATETAIPLLEDGARLSRDEFERRYEAMPHVKKAELIEGVVYMGSPERYRKHDRPNTHLKTWLTAYEADTPGVEAGGSGSVRIDDSNELQPDAKLMIDPNHGGRAEISADDYVELAPELLGEVSASTAKRDLTVKKEVYRRNAVLEYIVWRTLEDEIDWFVLRDDQYVPLQPDSDGILKSTVFPGLWLDAEAMIRGDIARVLAVLKQGTDSEEHTKFVERLQAHKQP